MGADAAARRSLAPAKVNLTLHVTGRRADGYHLLDSLVVFPTLGDHLSVEPASGLSLSLSGPFAQGLSNGSDNLVLLAAARLADRHGIEQGAALHLSKALPVASGIGGGSSDAAAALRLLSDMWNVAIPPDLALGLGADVPVCLAAPQPARMQGIGEQVTPVRGLSRMWIVLVNPLVAVPTAAVFKGLSSIANTEMDAVPSRPSTNFDALVRWLQSQRNDLQASAVAMCPVIDEVLSALSSAPFARMSGSGATCFGLCPDEASATALSDEVRRSRPSWWVSAGPVAP